MKELLIKEKSKELEELYDNYEYELGLQQELEEKMFNEFLNQERNDTASESN
jgi:hypothetical protein